ncbi:hypothetical protein H2248_007832 [Termitomyces sp. 'cryptogamus']|nr:hypothetical protein H2248_007832 [Termitomyces sp. 'cryptogamus']
MELVTLRRATRVRPLSSSTSEYPSSFDDSMVDRRWADVIFLVNFQELPVAVFPDVSSMVTRAMQRMAATASEYFWPGMEGSPRDVRLAGPLPLQGCDPKSCSGLNLWM